MQLYLAQIGLNYFFSMILKNTLAKKFFQFIVFHCVSSILNNYHRSCKEYN